MAITNGYTTLAQYKLAHRGEDVANVTDAVLEVYIEAASRAVDHICNRRFYSAAETRYYSARDAAVLMVDDYTSITTLKTDEDGDGTFEVTWTTSDYFTMPLNAVVNNEPFTEIHYNPNGNYTFPTGITKGVELAAAFGYATSTPTAVRVATELAASRYWARKDTPLGVSASAALGQLATVVREMESDPDIMTLLGEYRKLDYGST